MPRDPRPLCSPNREMNRKMNRGLNRGLNRQRRLLLDSLESRQLLATSELVVNGSFASDSTGWGLTGSFHADHAYQTYRSGPGYAYLAGSSGTLATSSNLTGTLKQTITLPASLGSADLSFWYRTATEDGTPQADSLAVRIRNSSGTLLQTLTTLYNQSMPAYVQSPVFSLANYIGQTIVLSFEGQTNATAGTVFRVDDVSIAGETPNTAAPTVAAPVLVSPGVTGTANLPTLKTPVPTFLWNAVPNAAGYGLKLEQLNGSVWSTLYNSEVAFGKLKGTSFTLPGALPAGTYRWSVRSFDSASNVTAYAPGLALNIATSGYTRALGLDVSDYQGISNSAWTTIKTNGTSNTTADDISFMWAKASEGVGAPEDTFLSKSANARAVGIPFGAYHYATPANGGSTSASMTADATNEANDFYSRISTTLLPGNLVPMLDFEQSSVTQSSTLLSLWVNTFCERITTLTGLTPIIYSGQSYASVHLNSTVLRYPIWIAQYPSSTDPQTDAPAGTTPWPTWSIWQYSGSGSVAGYSGAIDRDVFNGDVAALEGFKIKDTATFAASGTIFEDTDGNGVRDAGEAGISGRTVFLDANGNGAIDAGERTTLSAADGTYSFTGLLTGNYQVGQVVPGTSLATGALSQSFKLASGIANVAHDFGSRVIDATPPTIASSRFNYDTASHSISVVFSEDVGSSLDASKVTLTTAGVNVPVTFTYDAITRTAVFTPTSSALADGDYTLALAAGAVKDAAGNAIAASAVDFFWLAGDVTRDRSVNFDDLVVLAQNYGGTGRSWAQGDLTGDGNVDFDDLVVLSQSYGHSLTLAPPPALVVAPAPPTTPPTARKRVAPGVLS